jgi:hypothetical protein
MTKKKTEKDVDCVDMKRRGARAIHLRLKDKSREERLDYWTERTQALRKRQATPKSTSDSSSFSE